MILPDDPDRHNGAVATAGELADLIRASATTSRRTNSGAELWFADDLVLKRHAARTDPVALARRLAVAAAHDTFAPPVSTDLVLDADGRPLTVWPRVEVTSAAQSALPWADAGVLLARLHRTPVGELPRHGWAERVTRAASRAPGELAGLGRRLAGLESTGAWTLVHGDWHLGQLGRWTDGWRLLDIDDVGVGDPAWDLARPAGFWAAGLLADADWHTLLDAYRDSGGPAVPTHGDPWPALDLPARCAVFVAAVGELGRSQPHSEGTARALVEACRRMAQ